jgi:hypothetical protein
MKIEEEIKPCQEEQAEEEQVKGRAAALVVDAGEPLAGLEGQEAAKAQEWLMFASARPAGPKRPMSAVFPASR